LSRFNVFYVMRLMLVLAPLLVAALALSAILSTVIYDGESTLARRPVADRRI